MIGQIALSVMLLIGAGWFIRTLRNLENVDLGYPREKLALVGVDFLSGGYSGERLPIAYNEVRERLARIPGVRAVTYSQNGLFSGSESGDQISVEGYKSQKPETAARAFRPSRPELFCHGGHPHPAGARYWAADVESAESVCVVNEAFAKFYFGDRNPIGKHVTDEFPDTRKTFIIVGVARDARDHSLRREIFRRFYLSALQPLGGFAPYMNYEIRTYGDASGGDPGGAQGDSGVRSSHSDRQRRAFGHDAGRQFAPGTHHRAALHGLRRPGAAAGRIGLYGVLSYAVAQRTNEIGIRMALGAERGAVIRMVLRETAILIVIGLAIGVPASLACARFVESKLFGLKAADPVTLAAALGIMIVVAVASGYLPARRASKVDPLIALRYE